MSFGFGISDFVCCGQLAYQLYTEFKDAPGDCQALAKELLLFHQVILKTQALVRRRGDVLDEAEQATLGLCLEMCEDILFVQIVGADSARECLCTGQGGRLVQGRDGHLKLHFVTTPMKDHDHTRSPNFSPNYKYLLRQRLREWTFAKKIPKIRSAISTVIEKLTSFQVLTIRSLQLDDRDSLDELHKLQLHAYQQLEETHISVESATERLEQSQARIEVQLRALLESQQRDHGRPKSYSLDASSPEGRQTWMNLGRLLRAEGITPAMIEENRDLLVRAMKTSLEEDISPTQSYRTAPQSFEDDYEYMNIARPRQSMARSSASASTSLLGSAPVLGATFSKAFLERHNGAARSLDKEQNVQDGMKSLLKGMDTEEQADVEKDEEGDAINMEDM